MQLEAKKMKHSFWRLTQPGSCKYFKLNWNLEMEQLYMQKNNLEYQKDMTLSDKKGVYCKVSNEGNLQRAKEIVLDGEE
jgi:hypothetical protein